MKINIQKNIQKLIIQPVKTLFVIFCFITGILIFIKTYDYYKPDFTSGFLADKQAIFDGIFKYGLYAHIVSAPTVLFAGLLQFNRKLRERFLKFHKLLGRIYIFLILFVAAPGGLIMAFYAFGGILATINFIILAILWWIFTFIAFKKIRNKEIILHQKYMTRSMILTISAILFRFYSFVGAQFGFGGEAFYVFIVFMSWIPNLLIFEIWNLLKNKTL